MSTDSFFPRSKIWRRLLLSFLAIAILIPAFYLFEGARGKRQWNRYKAKLESAGEQLNVEAYIPAKVPDDKNFASTPFLEPLFQMTKVFTGPNAHDFHPEWLDKAGLKSAQEFGKILPEIGRTPPWMHGESLDLTTTKPKKGESVATIEEFMKQNTSVMREISEALNRPHSRFGIRYQDGYSALLPHLSVIRSLSRAFAIRACLNLRSNITEAAFADLQTALKLCGTIRNEPLLVSKVVQITIFHFALQPFWEGLSRHVWTEAHLKAIRRELDGMNFLREFDHTFRSERAFNNEFIAQMLENPERAFLMLGYPGNSSASQTLRLFPKGWIYLNQVTLNRTYQELIFPVVDPEKNRVDLEMRDKLTALLEGGVKIDNLISKTLLPAVDGSINKFAAAQTSLQLVTIACVLEEEFLRTGSYPRDLKNLAVPSQLLTDVIDGSPLKYRAEKNSYLIYSIGIDRKDDGGMNKKAKGPETQFPTKDGDWAWQIHETRPVRE